MLRTCRVETNMRLRRARLLTALEPHEICPSVTAFPLMGVGLFTDPPLPPGVGYDHENCLGTLDPPSADHTHIPP